MCGIAGVVDLTGHRGPAPRELLRAMVKSLNHRGPDEHGMYRDERAALGHARLSIIDLASGQQPMSNEDGTVWVVFNGEVFNHVELRAELTEKGHTFRTRSDTEVIVHAWEEWGVESFARFNGQWAIALWDAPRGELVLCRDRLGIRPLYLQESGGRLRFASEVKAIFADPEVPRAFDPRGIEETFTFWASRPPTSVFAGVTELRPGTARVYHRDGSWTERAYWSPRFARVLPRESREPETLTLDAAVEGLRERLEAASALRMLRADVPVGAYLSGGIDSSYIAWLARRAITGTFHTFSLRFEDAEYDETPFQRLMADALGTTHHEVVATRGDIADAFPDVVWHAERPILRTGPAPLFLLSKLVRDEGLKVVLTGEGSDEVLGGYDIFREAKVRRYWAREPDSKTRPRLFERLYPYLSRSPAAARGMALQFWARGLDRASEPTFSHGPRWSSAQALQRYFSADWKGRAESDPRPAPVDALVASLPEDFTRWDPLCQAQYLEMVTLLDPYILASQGDRMLMAHSVEGRFPFLDVNVVEFAGQMPARFKLSGLDEKHVLKRAAEEPCRARS
ncbi:MAG: asparagine synthase (glutamine-hydrolyzing) [Polyangiales bacterium]